MVQHKIGLTVNTKENGIEKVMEIIKVFHAHKKLYERMRMKGDLYEKSKQNRAIFTKAR